MTKTASMRDSEIITIRDDDQMVEYDIIAHYCIEPGYGPIIDHYNGSTPGEGPRFVLASLMYLGGRVLVGDRGEIAIPIAPAIDGERRLTSWLMDKFGDEIERVAMK